jgi:hypothetical protein
VRAAKEISWIAHAAVEQTFVQFYPTLKVVAKKFWTYNEAREQVTEAK